MGQQPHHYSFYRVERELEPIFLPIKQESQIYPKIDKWYIDDWASIRQGTIGIMACTQVVPLSSR